MIAANDNFLVVRQYGADWDRLGETSAIERKVGIHENLGLALRANAIFCFNSFSRWPTLLGKHCSPQPAERSPVLALGAPIAAEGTK